MKITRRQLRRLIKEELNRALLAEDVASPLPAGCDPDAAIAAIRAFLEQDLEALGPVLVAIGLDITLCMVGSTALREDDDESVGPNQCIARALTRPKVARLLIPLLQDPDLQDAYYCIAALAESDILDDIPLPLPLPTL